MKAHKCLAFIPDKPPKNLQQTTTKTRCFISSWHQQHTFECFLNYLTRTESVAVCGCDKIYCYTPKVCYAPWCAYGTHQWRRCLEPYRHWAETLFLGQNAATVPLPEQRIPSTEWDRKTYNKLYCMILHRNNIIRMWALGDYKADNLLLQSDILPLLTLLWNITICTCFSWLLVSGLLCGFFFP